MLENKPSKSRSHHDWSFISIGIVLALGLAWGLGYVQARDTERHNQTASFSEEKVSVRVRRQCGDLPSNAMYSCADNLRSKMRQSGRDDLEISIQQRAALSSLVSAIVAGLALVATVVGLFFVRATLLATLKAVEGSGEATVEMRRANTISTENSHRELRAYLSCRSVTVTETEWDDDEFVVSMTILNSGQTPATMTRIVCKALWWNKNGVTELTFYDQPNIYQCHKDTPLTVPLPFSGSFVDHELNGNLFVMGKLYYRDVFSKDQVDNFGWISPDKEFGAFYDIDFPLNLNAYSPETARAMIKRQRVAASA